jgi:hypothetical protein
MAISAPVVQVGPLGYFVNISITTPIASALKNYYKIDISRSSNGYFKPLLDPGGGFIPRQPHGGFRSETAVTKPFRN